MKVDMMKYWRSSIVLAIVVLALLVSPTMTFAHNANPGVFPINSRPFGLTYGQWSARWWQFAFQQENLEFCKTDKPGSKVVFLAGTPGPPAVTRPCTVHTGQAIMFPVFNVSWSRVEANIQGNKTPGQTCLVPTQPNGTDYAALRACATAQANNATQSGAKLEAEVDGKTLQNLTNYRAVSPPPPFTFTAVKGNPFGVCELVNNCSSGSLTSRAVADGFWIMLKPLSPGKHTIHFAATVPFPNVDQPFTYTADTTYHVTVC
jgi:hypothetical protein